MSADTRVAFGGVTPILRVSDFDASARWYIDVLGFTLQWRVGQFGCVSRGEASVMLSQGSQGHAGTWLYFGVDDADALHAEIVHRGAEIRQPPTNFPWGSGEVYVFDPDRHVLRFGSDVREGEPYGPWIDEDGTRWMPGADGSWTRA